MREQQTCGQGLAQHSVLPKTMGELIDAMAGNLEVHSKALDRTDPDARKEYDAYVELAAKQRKAATELKAIAAKMSGSRDMPMGRHAEKAMSTPETRRAFEKLVRSEEELLSELQDLLALHHDMLSGWH